MKDLYQFIYEVTAIGAGEHAGFAVGSPRNLHAVPVNKMREFLENPALMAGNFFFSCSALDGNGHLERNCTATGSIIADIDCGKTGHKKVSPFETREADLDAFVRRHMVVKAGGKK